MTDHTNNQGMSHGRGNGPVAAILILIGTILLLHNFNLLPFEFPSYFFSWKMVLIVLGTISIFRGKLFPGITLLAVGIYFIAPEMFQVSAQQLLKLWPLVLIILGIAVLTKGKKKIKPTRIINKENMAGHISNSVIFGGISRKITNKQFEGGRLIAVFGGLELDLTDCVPSETNKDIVIDVTAVFGGISLKVPKEWIIKNEIVPIMGGFEDNGQKQNYHIGSVHEIIITGNAVFGGIEIKRSKE